MTVASADLDKAINAVWDASTLDTLFQALHKSDVSASQWSILNNDEASPKQPFPYCVYSLRPSATTTRMSAKAGFLWEIRDIVCEFRVHARKVSGDSRSAKQIAAYLVEEIMKIFGGHPTQAPTDLELDNGNFLITEYQNDMGLRTGESEYQWGVTYLFRLDVPVAV